MDVLAALLHELEVPDQALSLLVAHARGVLHSADRLGLVAERDLDAILSRHTADSLLPALVRRPASGEQWLDAGSGAGFPGLVLAIAFSEARFLLVEPQQRRMGFLELSILNLGLGNVSVTRERLQRIPPGSADVVVARALEDPSETFPLLKSIARSAVLISAGPGTPKPEGTEVFDVRRPFVDSPGLVFMMTSA